LPRADLDPLVGGPAGRRLGLLALALGMAGLAATATRSALLALAVGLSILWLLGPRAAPQRRRRLALVAGMTLLAGLGVAAPALLELRREANVLQPGELSAGAASAADRLVLWRAGGAMIAQRPLLGIGANRTRREAARFLPPEHRRPGPPAHLHSAPLTLAAERGLPALALAMWLYAASLRRFGRLTTGPGGTVARGAGAAVAAFLVMGLFEDNFGDTEVLFVHLITLSVAWTGGAADGGADPAAP
jgi:O-antigen ligase